MGVFVSGDLLLLERRFNVGVVQLQLSVSTDERFAVSRVYLPRLSHSLDPCSLVENGYSRYSTTSNVAAPSREYRRGQSLQAPTCLLAWSIVVVGLFTLSDCVMLEHRLLASQRARSNKVYLICRSLVRHVEPVALFRTPIIVHRSTVTMSLAGVGKISRPFSIEYVQNHKVMRLQTPRRLANLLAALDKVVARSTSMREQPCKPSTLIEDDAVRTRRAARVRSVGREDGKLVVRWRLIPGEALAVVEAVRVFVAAHLLALAVVVVALRDGLVDVFLPVAGVAACGDAGLALLDCACGVVDGSAGHQGRLGG
jgi:hypothetical protein